MKKVLYLCWGNVARSQMAEGWHNHLTKKSLGISAGNLEETPRKYKSPLPDAVTAMQEVGVDISAQYPKLVTQEMIDAAEVVIVLCQKDQCLEVVTASSKTLYRTLEDPYDKGINTYRLIRDQIKPIVEEVIGRVGEE